MAGIAMLSDLLRKNSGLYSSHSVNSFSARVAFSASAAASIAASKPFAYRALFGDEGPRLAYCDAAAVAESFSAEDYISNIGSNSESILQYESKPLMQKEYHVELKPLWYAFQLKQFAVISLRALLLNYLPLLEHHKNAEEEDDDMFPENQESREVDLVAPLRQSLFQIMRETSIVTTRRILERVTILHVTQRTAWKLLKDASESALRKAQRGFPTYIYIFRVGRTTFRNIDADTRRQPAKYLAKKATFLDIRPYRSSNNCHHYLTLIGPVDWLYCWRSCGANHYLVHSGEKQFGVLVRESSCLSYLVHSSELNGTNVEQPFISGS